LIGSLPYRERVYRRVRFALAPGWLALHLLCITLVVTMVLLGRWQLNVSDRKHFSLQNFGYALQWWTFSAFVIVMWARLLRDAARQRSAESSGSASSGGARGQGHAERADQPHGAVAYRRYVMPNSAQVIAPDDPTRAAYNEYLIGLAAQDVADSVDNAEGNAR
jgi:DNA-binding transcriptional regulator of glucitol operon